MRKLIRIRKQCAVAAAVLLAMAATVSVPAAEAVAVQSQQQIFGPFGLVKETAAADADTDGGLQQPPAGTDSAQGQVVAEPEITEESIDAYFDDSVMVGDSIMLGFRNYAMRRQDTWLSRLKFLSAGSYSTSHALEPVTQKSLHPMYAGQKRQIWDSIALMGAKKVFLLFGMNDLNISGIEGTCENYKAIAANIKALSPDAEIHLISMTYVLHGKAKGKLNNDNIRVFNEELRKLAADNGWGYVDLAPHLADAGGDLAAVYCSDSFVHQTPEAYDVWCAVLREYAKGKLKAAALLTPSDEAPQTPGPLGAQK